MRTRSLLLAGLLALLPSARTAAAATAYTFSPALHVPDSGDQQGLAWSDGTTYVGFDRGGGRGQVLGYDRDGRQTVATGLLPLGHVAELDVRQADGNVYAATGGAQSPTRVNVVDLRRSPPVVVRTYDFSALGPNGLVAVDDARDRMLVFSGRDDAGRWRFTWSDWSGRTTPAFTLVDPWVPQGLEVVGDQVLYLASAPDRSRNSIRVLGLTGVTSRVIAVPVADEAEGLAAEPGTGRLNVGYKAADRVDRMSPVLAAPLGVELLADRGAESGTGGSSPADARAVPSWAASGMTVLSWSAGDGHPTAASPGPPARGRLFFAGGTGATGTLRQVLPLEGLPVVDVDAGRVQVTLSGWLGGYRDQDDSATVAVVFRAAGGSTVGSTRIGPVRAADRGGVTGLLRRARTASVPPGTRSAEVVVTATRVRGANLDAYVDDLSLVLRTGG